MYDIKQIRKALKGSGVRVSTRNRPYPLKRVLCVYSIYYWDYYHSKERGFTAEYWTDDNNGKPDMINIFIL